MTTKSGLLVISSIFLSLIILLGSVKIINAACYCGSVQWYYHQCSTDPSITGCQEGAPCGIGGSGTCVKRTQNVACQDCCVPGTCSATCGTLGLGAPWEGATGSCYVCSNPNPSPGATPPPGGSCMSSWCTTPAECAAVGGTTGSGAGYCNPSTLVRCCPAGGGGGFTPSCPWDTSSTGYGYPACLLGEGNACEGSICVPFGNNCAGHGCAAGLIRNGSGTCVCPPDPTCSISITEPIFVDSGGQAIANPTVTATNGTVTSVSFGVGSPTKISATTPDNSSPFTSTITGIAQGSSALTIGATMNNNAGMNEGVRCTYTATVIVNPPRGWWQVINGDVVAGGNLQSLIPTTCVAPGCTPRFMLDGTGTYPGLAVYGGSSYDFSAGATNGTVSSKNWLANSIYGGKTYNYAYFEGQLPSDVVLNDISTDTVAGGYFNAGGTPSKGYVWYRRNGDLTINGNLNLTGSRKVILLVNGGNLTINGQMNIQTPGQGFIMAIAGKDSGGNKGDINISSTVGGGATANVEGLYLADHQIKTGAGNTRLYIRGVLVGNEGVVLERDLGAGNSTGPGELIEYAPDLLFSYPRNFSRSRITWREVAP